MSLINPIYEVGIDYPINQKNKKPETKINLPIPQGVTFFREFKKGETLPITFTATGDLVQLASTQQTITFMQDVFIKATKKEILFSLDQKNWKPFQEIITGSINAKVEQSNDTAPQALIHLFANAVKPKVAK